jgi:hypothetical protein
MLPLLAGLAASKAGGGGAGGNSSAEDRGGNVAVNPAYTGGDSKFGSAGGNGSRGGFTVNFGGDQRTSESIIDPNAPARELLSKTGLVAGSVVVLGILAAIYIYRRK